MDERWVWDPNGGWYALPAYTRHYAHSLFALTPLLHTVLCCWCADDYTLPMDARYVSSSGTVVLPGYVYVVFVCIRMLWEHAVIAFAPFRCCPCNCVSVSRWRNPRKFKLQWDTNSTTHGMQYCLHVKATSSWGGVTRTSAASCLTVDFTPPQLSVPLPTRFGPAFRVVQKQTGAPGIAFLFLDNTRVEVGA